MRFKQYLQEAAPIEITDFVLDHARPLISEYDCEPSELIKECKLYRGMEPDNARRVQLSHNGKLFGGHIKQVRTDRQPLDTHPDLHRVLDDFFEHNYGWRARSSGLFIMGKSGRPFLEDYGDIHRVFPMGKFKFLWSPSVHDLTHTVHALLVKHKLPIKRNTISYTEDELLEFVDLISQELTGVYEDSDLHAAQSGAPREIMIKCTEYLAVRDAIMEKL